MINNKLRILLLLLLISVLCPSRAQRSLRDQFTQPSEEAKPWTFWYWMYGAVSKEGITADLEAMKQAGLGGTYLMPIKSAAQAWQYKGKAEQLSPEWWEMVHFSMKEADRLGLKLGMHICDGFALAGGPWISPQESMQKVVWTDTIVQGGHINLRLQQPETFRGYYKDIALLAIPSDGTPDEQAFRMTCANIDPGSVGDPTKGVNIDEKGVIRSNYPCYIQVEYDQPFTCRNIEISAGVNSSYQANRLKVMASDDGENYRYVKQLIPARQGWQNWDENSTHAIPPTTARYFRFYWTPEGTEPGSEDMNDAKWKPNLKIGKLQLHSQPRLNQWEGKAGFVWRVAQQTQPTEIGVHECAPLKRIVNLTASMKNGVITTTLPAGNWKLLRMGHTSTGHDNATGGGGRGLECDKFSADAVRKQFNNWFAMAFAQSDVSLPRRVLKYMHIDSWECGSQNWSDNFAAEFKQRRGYDLMPYLPVMAGIPVESAARSEEVLRDVRTTISELVVDVFYTVMSDCAHKYDCRISAECVSPTMVSDGMLHYQKVDLPMGEFWLNSPTHDKLNDMLDAISGAHIYGKNIIQAEGFTEVRGTWDEHPAMLKTLLDRNYALGINKLFYHVYVHNPWMDRRPGMTLDGIGLFFQRDQTWWKDGARSMTEYMTRCQALLQYGHPVTDVAVFTGEEIPRRAILPDRLVPSLPGIYGAERVESERVRLANENQPMRVRPVGVTHSANMADPEDWVNPMRGYAYDSFNRDALLRLAKAENGCMTLPGGASYKVVVLPLPHPMTPDSLPLSKEVLTKIAELEAAGVVIPRLPYVNEDFSEFGLERDLNVPAGIAWTHRRGEEADIYFVSNQQDKARRIIASMRISGKKPELWNPMTGEINSDVSFTQRSNGRTDITLSLAPNESVFIVLKEDAPVTPQEEAKQDVVYEVRTANVFKTPLQTSDFNITFAANGKLLKRNTLFDWSKETDDAIKYYSGTAVYKTTFTWKESQAKRVFLTLGEVNNVATVRVNGQDCGTVWTAPYQVEITGVVKKGSNQLEIEVTNTWANALKGSDEGKAPFEGIWTNGNYRMQESVLLPAGLLGPLELAEETNE